MLVFKMIGCGKEEQMFVIFDLCSYGVLNDAVSYSACYIDYNDITVSSRLLGRDLEGSGGGTI